MALPTDPRALNNIVATTFDAVLPEVTDGFFPTNAVTLRLLQRYKGGDFRRIKERAGGQIRSLIQYAGLPAYGYDRGFTFGTGQKEIVTALLFQWKRVACELNLDHLDIRENAGDEEQIVDYVEIVAENCMNSLQNMIGYRLFGTQPDPSTGLTVTNSTPTIDPITGSAAIDGFYNAVATTGVYGGITRGATYATPGWAILSNVTNAGGAPYSNDILQEAYGNATFGNEQPDLICTTQLIFNEMWQRAQAQDRNAPGPLRDVGFTTIKFNQAEVVVDSHVLAGDIWLFNTKFIELWVMKGVDFIRRSGDPLGFPVPTQDAFVDQLIAYMDVICPGPRYQSKVTNLI